MITKVPLEFPTEALERVAKEWGWDGESSLADYTAKHFYTQVCCLEVDLRKAEELKAFEEGLKIEEDPTLAAKIAAL